MQATFDSDLLTPGTLLGERYALREALAAGGVGVVYDAFDTHEAREVAIKVLNREFAEHESLRPRFEREAHVALSLGHPNIVLVTDHGVHDGRPYLVMERLRGRTLHARLTLGPLDQAETFDVMLQLLEGLAHAHSMAVVHRDLKPGNIFLHGDPKVVELVKILDFGFAKLLAPDPELHGKGAHAQLTGGGVTFGTPTYMAPEQIALGAMDARTDVYAAGILLFEFLSGRPPFSGELPQVLRQHLAQELPPIEQLRRGVRETPALRALLARATAKLPRERFADAGELSRALQALPAPWLLPTT